MLKRPTFWIVFVIVLLAAGVGASMLKKKSAPAAVAAPTMSTLEFLPTDVTEVKPRDLRQVYRLSGALRAVNQAAVKARVPGEVREVLVREGDAVKAGQILIKMDASEYQARMEQSRGALVAARGQLEIATKSRDNNQALMGKGFISKTALDNAESQFNIAQANVESAKGALDVAQKLLNDTVIRAPISGLVSSRTIQPGEKVSADNRLLDVVDLQKMEMEAAVPTADIANIALGQEVQVKVEGIPDILSGKVARINPATQTGSRSILTYIQIDNPNGVLRAGMFAEAQLTLSRKALALTVPQSALQMDNGTAFVYAIESARVTRKPVVAGIQGEDGEGAAVEIINGLENGAQIVRTNLGNLQVGTAVKFAKPVEPAAPTTARAAQVPAAR